MGQYKIKGIKGQEIKEVWITERIYPDNDGIYYLSKKAEVSSPVEIITSKGDVIDLVTILPTDITPPYFLNTFMLHNGYVLEEEQLSSLLGNKGSDEKNYFGIDDGDIMEGVTYCDVTYKLNITHLYADM